LVCAASEQARPREWGLSNVRFGALYGLKADISRRPRSAITGLMHRSKKRLRFVASNPDRRLKSALPATAHRGVLPRDVRQITFRYGPDLESTIDNNNSVLNNHPYVA
jgi:hypothetical protein